MDGETITTFLLFSLHQHHVQRLKKQETIINFKYDELNWQEQ